MQPHRELQGGPQRLTYKKQPIFSYKVPLADRLPGPAAHLDSSGARPAWPIPGNSQGHDPRCFLQTHQLLLQASYSPYFA